MATLTKKESALRKATREIVTALGFEDEVTHEPIKVDESLSDKDIEDMFNEAIGLLTPKDKAKFSPETLQIIHNAAPDLFLPTEDEKPADVVIVENEKAEEKPADDLISQINAAERLKDLRAIALSNDKFKAIRGKLSSFKSLDDLRDALLGVLDEETPAEAAERMHKTNIADKGIKVGDAETKGKEAVKKPAAEAKKSAPPKEPKVSYSRVDSICDALKQDKAKTKDELVTLANTLYVDNGGTDNVKESKATLKYVLPALAAFEIEVPTK